MGSLYIKMEYFSKPPSLDEAGAALGVWGALLGAAEEGRLCVGSCIPSPQGARTGSSVAQWQNAFSCSRHGPGIWLSACKCEVMGFARAVHGCARTRTCDEGGQSMMWNLEVTR